MHGFFLEGAGWEKGSYGEGYITDSTLKDLHPSLPVIHCVAVTRDKAHKIG